MLKDRYFYPLALLIILGIVGFALSLGGGITPNDLEIREQGYVMEGEDFIRMTAQPGIQTEFVAAAAGEPAYIRLVSNVARDNLPPGPGVFAPLTENYERAFAGQKLRLTITARSSRINPLDAFDMAYFTAGAGDSGWKRRALSEQWADYTMEFTPGALTARADIDYFSIWPGTTAEALAMDVRKMRIEVLP